MNKKVRIGLIVLLSLVAVYGMIGSGAWFADPESVNGNAFEAGKIDLMIGDAQGLPFNVEDVHPGQTGQGKVRLTNAEGSMPAMLSISLVNKVEDENVMIEPETENFGGTVTGDYLNNGAELDFFLGFAAYVDVNKDGVFNSGDYQLTYNGQKAPYPGFWGGDFHYHNINSMVSGSWGNIMTLSSGQSVDLIIMWKFPEESEDGNYHHNISMTDTLGFDALLRLDQVH